jgi:hypothetical protein
MDSSVATTAESDFFTFGFTLIFFLGVAAFFFDGAAFFLEAFAFGLGVGSSSSSFSSGADPL